MNTWRTSLVALLLSVALPVWGGTIVSTYGDTWTWDGSIGGALPVNQPKRTGPMHGVCVPWPWSPQPASEGMATCASASDTLDAARAAWSFIAPSIANADGIELVIMRLAFWPGNEVTVGLYAESGGRPGSLLREATVSGQMLPIGPADRTGSVVRAAFASVVSLTGGSPYWIVLSAPSSGATTTLVTWWYASGAVSGAGLVECPAAWHTWVNQQPERIAAGLQGCYLGLGAWHPVSEFYRYTLAHPPAFRVTSP